MNFNILNISFLLNILYLNFNIHVAGNDLKFSLHDVHFTSFRNQYVIFIFYIVLYLTYKQV